MAIDPYGKNTKQEIAMAQAKRCTRCNQNKPKTREFFPAAPGGLHSYCKKCMAQISRDYRRKCRDNYASCALHRRAVKKCSKCQETLPTSAFGKDVCQKDGLSAKCRECSRIESAGFRAKNPLYNTWYTILERCYNPKNKKYKYYGARGILVCDQWKESFHLFQKWALSRGWKKGLEIDRKNNDGHYSPQNCRVTTRSQNMRNTRVNVLSLRVARKIKKIREQTGKGAREISRLLDLPLYAVNNVIYGNSWKET